MRNGRCDILLVLMWFGTVLAFATGIALAQGFVDVTKVADVGDFGPAVGVNFCDYDGDGWADILVTNDPIARGRFSENRLYRNNRDGTFTEVAKKVGLDIRVKSGGSPFVDYDNDGDLDLYITNVEMGNILYQNVGNGTFIDVTQQAGIPGKKDTTVAVWGDYDNDGYLDLYLSCGNVLDNLAHPNILYHNNGDGTFTDVTEEAGVGDDGNGWGALFFDYDDDGDLDLCVGNYKRKSDVLYRNNGDGTFTDVTKEAGINFWGRGHGPIAGDYDNDGDLDLYLPNNGPNVLYRNNGDGTFTDVTKETGVGSTGHTMGPIFFDYDNDGDLDIYSPSWERVPNAFYRNNGDGTFTNIAAEVGLELSAQSWGAAAADYDNDGDLDIYLGNWKQANVLYRNDVGNQNNWLHLKLIGTRSNRNAIGARIRLTSGSLIQTREIHSVTCFSQNSLVVEFGLEQQAQADILEIRWPSGTVDVYTNIAANQKITVIEGVGWKRGILSNWAVTSRGKKTSLLAQIKRSALLPNYPNPFNPETWIPFQLAEPGDVVVNILDLQGRLVRKLEIGYRPVGYYVSRDRAAHWDGRNDRGERVASGVYLVSLEAGDFTATRWMVLVK